MSVGYLNWSSGSSKLLTISGAAVSAVAIGLWASRKYIKDRSPPTEWRSIGKLSDIYMYPVKSMGNVRVEEMDFTETGLCRGYLRDRVFVVIDEHGKFLTARQYPQLVQIKPSVTGNIITLTASTQHNPLRLDMEKLSKIDKLQEVVIFSNPASGVDCGDEASRWLSNFLFQKDTGARLLYYPHVTSIKPFSPSHNVAGVTRSTDTGTYSDALSFNLLSKTSVKDLNTRLDKHVSPVQFRPSFVVDGFQLLPYEEDNWTWVKIGDHVFQYLSPCGRCVLTTVDPETGIKHPEFEPLMTLRKYRGFRNDKTRKIMSDSPQLGIYLGLRSNPGTVRVGDEVFIPKQ